MQEITHYLEWKAINAPRAAEIYGTFLVRFFEETGKTIDDVTIVDIVGYARKMKKDYAPSTISYFLTVIKNFIKFYKLQGRGQINSELIKVPRVRSNSHRPISYEEFKAMVAVFDGDRSFTGLRDNCIIRLLWDTGMRVSELCDMNWTDIDIQKNSALIKNKKNMNSRIVVWGEETALHLKNYTGVRIAMNGTNPLFVGLYNGKTPSERISTRTVQRIVSATAKKAGIEHHLSPHSSRHGWAVYRREMGAQLTFIQKGLGHTNPAATMIYEQYRDPDFMSTAQRFLAIDKVK